MEYYLQNRYEKHSICPEKTLKKGSYTVYAKKGIASKAGTGLIIFLVISRGVCQNSILEGMNFSSETWHSSSETPYSLLAIKKGVCQNSILEEMNFSFETWHSLSAIKKRECVKIQF